MGNMQMGYNIDDGGRRNLYCARPASPDGRF